MSNNDHSRAIAAQLQALREHYRQRLPAELEELHTLAGRLLQASPGPDTLADLQQRLHKLAGSGGTFGLPKLSRQARRLEQALTRAGPTPQALHTVIDGLRQLTALEQPAVHAACSGRALQHPSVSDMALIWLVEDDRTLALKLQGQLASFGYRVRCFSRLTDAELAAGHGQPDILLIDVMLEQEGINTTEQLGRLPALQQLSCAVVFISAQDDFTSRIRAAKLGAEGYFLKPIEVPRLVNRISRILENRAAPPERVLIVEDDQLLAAHYRLALEYAGMQVQVLAQPEDIAATVFAFRPELILMDLYMPDYSGPELAGVLRQYDHWTSLPIVYLSAETDLGLQIQAMKSGADDFLTKPISDAQLAAAVRIRVKRARELMIQINRDSLTGLLKHASIKEAMETELAHARRTNTPVTLAMLDIDHFKVVNDSHGHATGDVVIAAIATLLRQRLRHSDIIGRYGGEEFLAVLPQCDAAAAYRIMDEIRHDFALVRFSKADTGFTCTLSVGLACSITYPECSAAELLAHADQALYAAKHGGRNQTRTAGECAHSPA